MSGSTNGFVHGEVRPALAGAEADGPPAATRWQPEPGYGTFSAFGSADPYAAQPGVEAGYDRPLEYDRRPGEYDRPVDYGADTDLSSFSSAFGTSTDTGPGASTAYRYDAPATDVTPAVAPAPAVPDLAAGRPPWQFAEFTAGLKQFGIGEVPHTQGMSGVPEVVMGGRRLINFAPVNFLNLHSRPDVMGTFTRAAREYGLATGGARISQGVTQPHMDMEAELCRILGKPRAIGYATGMVANIGFVHALSNKQVWSDEMKIDHTDVVFVYDRDNHWSLWKAAEKLEYGKNLFSFKHNNAEDLDKVLSRLPGKRIVVVFESVYSVDGSVAPMHDIVDVCEKYGALSYVDDANGFLVYGPAHRPFAREYAGMLRSTFIMVSLKKSVGLEGGLIAGPDDAIYAMEALGMASVFTAQVQPPTAVTAAYSMRLLTEREPEIVDDYLAKVARFREMIADEGFPLNPTPSIMTSIDVGKEATGMALREAFLQRGYRIPVYIFPAARRNHATMRLILNATHTDEHIEGFLDLMREFRDEYFELPGGRHRFGRRPSRDATTRWVGGLRDGAGQISLDASNSGQIAFSYNSRTGRQEGQTTPEELIAAAHSSCLAMNLSGVLDSAGLKAENIDVSSEVKMGDVDGTLGIAELDVTLRATVHGLDEVQFADLAGEALRTCPVSRALTGTKITLDAALEGRKAAVTAGAGVD